MSCPAAGGAAAQLSRRGGGSGSAGDAGGFVWLLAEAKCKPCRCLVARTHDADCPGGGGGGGWGRMALEEGSRRFVNVPALDTSNKNSSALLSHPLLALGWHQTLLTAQRWALFLWLSSGWRVGRLGSSSGQMHPRAWRSLCEGQDIFFSSLMEKGVKWWKKVHEERSALSPGPC